MPYVWYDGGHMPEASVFEGTIVDPNNAKKFDLILIGDKGKFLFNRNSQKWKTTPEDLIQDTNPDKTMDPARRVQFSPQNWKGPTQTCSQEG